MIVTQHAHIYSFHTSKFNFGEIFFPIFLSIQPLVRCLSYAAGDMEMGRNNSKMIA
jgi:hypothetical protein